MIMRIDLLPCLEYQAPRKPRHAEKWPGPPATHYTRGLSNAEIPISGRIVAIADTFDALTSRRAYKDSYPIGVAADIIQSEREKHFDPDLTDVFIGHIDEIGRIREEVGREVLREA